MMKFRKRSTTRRSSFGVGVFHFVPTGSHAFAAFWMMFFVCVAVRGDDSAPRFRNTLGEWNFEQYQFSGSESSLRGREPSAWWVYVGLPGFELLKRNIFVALEVDGVYRDLRYKGDLGKPPMQRYGAFFGVGIVHTKAQDGSLLIGTGVASDFEKLTWDSRYFHFIYNHTMTLSENLTVGMGVLYSRNLGGNGRTPVNLLPTVKWKISPRTFVDVSWDNAEFRWYVVSRLALALNARYDMSFFRVGEQALAYQLETVGGGGGFDYQIIDDLFLKVRYKEILWGREFLGKYPAEPYVEDEVEGRSVRVFVTFAR